MSSKNNMNIISFILITFVVLVILYLYQRYQHKIDRENVSYNFDIIQKYLLSDPDDIRLEKISKPILWIFIDYEYNARKWESFGSRSSYNLNQPYLYLTVKSIIDKCDDSFHICLIDAQSFTNLLPNWNVNMSRISSPIKSYMVDLGMTKLLYRYGGIRVPPSFICMRNLIGLYNDAKMSVPFIGEFVNRNITSTYHDFYPNMEFMGCRKEDIVIGELIEFIQRNISTDNTDETSFLGSFNRWCNSSIDKGKMKLIDGELLGTKTVDNRQIVIDQLLTENYIDFNKKMYGIYIPENEVLKRSNYSWFARMSPKQVLQGNMIVSKYLLLTNASYTGGVIEPMTKNDNKYIGFWKVPSGAPVWGLKPVDLGNNVPKMSYPMAVA